MDEKWGFRTREIRVWGFQQQSNKILPGRDVQARVGPDRPAAEGLETENEIDPV